MIKNLITSMMLATSIGIQNTTTNNIISKNEFRYVNNIQDSYNYDQDEGTLKQHQQVKTIDYTTALFGSNFNIQARSILYINEDKGYDNYDYNQIILLKINNLASLTIQDTKYSFYSIPQNIDKTINDNFDVLSINYLSSLTTAQQDFLDGANYNSYTDLYNVYNSIKTNMQLTIDIPQTNAPNYTIYSTQAYVVIYANLNYVDNLIGYNGSFMFTMNAPIMTINEEIIYEVPTITNYEVIDLPGLMFTILGMPFAWLSTAFNFTIFPGTPYAVNLSHILMAIVISLIVLYIVKKIIK